MPAIAFDTLKMVETLEAGGFTDQQARAVVTALGDAATVANVATRADLLDLGIGLKHDIEDFKTEVKHDIDAFKTEVKHDIDAFKTEVKHDIDVLKTEVKRDIDVLKTEVKRDIDAFKTDVKHDIGVLRADMLAMEQRVTIRMGGMMVALAGVLSAAFHYLR
jgi:hypothetical protein